MEKSWVVETGYGPMTIEIESLEEITPEEYEVETGEPFPHRGNEKSAEIQPPVVNEEYRPVSELASHLGYAMDKNGIYRKVGGNK